MNTERTLEKAKLVEITWNESGRSVPVPDGKELEVQFNPASLKVNFSNQIQTNDQSTSSAIQYVGKGSSKLAIELIFDVSAPGERTSGDVRDKTLALAAFMEAEPEGEGEEQRYVPPGVRFTWGSFLFEGIIESMDETLELWSEDGRPLRATVSFSLSQQGIFTERNNNPSATPPPATGNPRPGTTPMQPARAGDSVQRMAGRNGRGDQWKSMADRNDIENPRHVPPGTMLTV